MSPPNAIAPLQSARLGLLHVLAILDAANNLPVNDIADLDILVGAARDLCGRHLEEVDGAIDALKAGGAA